MSQRAAMSPDPRSRKRKGTSTSNFGVSRREGHDSSGFYARFPLPEISSDDTVADAACRDEIWHGDARNIMDTTGHVADNSVALVVTSPPYFAGKAYEEAVGQGHIPADYFAYLQMLHDVFEVCVRKLEPGGRIAVNVANLGRRPYRSLSSDVILILQDLRLLLRGEVIWRKARGAAASFAWGSFQRPGNPVLRDVTERVVIASKGRFDRAVRPADRDAQDKPAQGSAAVDEFMEATVDIWDIRPESATRVGHPAPFPVELPKRLIDLYTYRGDLVLDPFMGAGTTAVAAVRTGRHYVGCDTDSGYVDLARQRVEQAEHETDRRPEPWPVTVPPSPDREVPVPAAGLEDLLDRAMRRGDKARAVAQAIVERCGFSDIDDKVKLPAGVKVDFAAHDPAGRRWLFVVAGAFSASRRIGLRSAETLWNALGRAAVLHALPDADPLVLLTTAKPARHSSGHRAMEAITGPDKALRAVIDLNDVKDLQRLKSLPAAAS